MNLVNDLARHESPCSSVALAEHPTGVRKGMGSTPVGNSDFFLCPLLVTNWNNIFFISGIEYIKQIIPHQVL